jgi:hypothetical protein
MSTPKTGASGIITLLTDFGSGSPYVAILKGLTLGRGLPVPVDLSHEIAPGGLREAQFFLAHTVRSFPAGTVHLAVIDPGVGTDRRALALAAGGQWFVGPDNGIFTFLIADITAAFAITNPEIIAPHPAPTFHGRDIFLPAALHLASGGEGAQIGPPVEAASLAKDHLPQPHIDAHHASGEIIYIDRFGNLVTNLPGTLALGDRPFTCRFADWTTDRLQPSYGHAPPGATLLTVGSFGMLEIAVNGGSAAARFGFATGSTPIATVWFEFTARRSLYNRQNTSK